jgi:hypothetical protein
MQCCTNPEAIPLFVTVRKQILADVSQRIQGIMTTNYALYAAVRVPGAVVPFGIQLTNFLDTIRLTHKILRVVGMTEDHESIASAAAAGRIMWVKNAAVGVLTDLYTFTAGGAVSLSLASTVLMGDSFAAALSAFAATDLVFVGAISVISGAVSAITGAISRPHLATSITELISTLQTLWLLCTDVRRRPVDEVLSSAQASICLPPSPVVAAMRGQLKWNLVVVLVWGTVICEVLASFLLAASIVELICTRCKSSCCYAWLCGAGR